MKTADEMVDNQTQYYLGEEARPVGLNIDTGSLEDGGDLLRGDGDVVVGEDEGGVDASKLRVGHLLRFDAVSARDLAQTENKQSANNSEVYQAACMIWRA